VIADIHAMVSLFPGDEHHVGSLLDVVPEERESLAIADNWASPVHTLATIWADPVKL